MAESSAKFDLGKLDLVEIVTKNKMTEKVEQGQNLNAESNIYLVMFVFTHTKSNSYKNYNKI